MNKKIKVIDLLNKIANGEPLPERIHIADFGGSCYNKDVENYFTVDKYGVYSYLFSDDILNILNNEIKVLKGVSILDDKEKEYLGNIIKPFRDKVKYIVKNSNYDKEEYIYIEFKGSHGIFLPDFEEGKMYKNMIVEKEYTLEELGL